MSVNVFTNRWLEGRQAGSASSATTTTPVAANSFANFFRPLDMQNPALIAGNSDPMSAGNSAPLLNFAGGMMKL